ncbi:hypothetical protein NC653_007747 [Populus alba x Populus x berolinensis]|uniref:Uncharacterized protein n=1 Tax=Populus alba x Populus x berolinensis TaxID=444605 RepID=A0AAD6RHN1_9ROSI|nr:hypothetical protein NC653_007747 [Populus alba x Populus x berolinensis]
MDGFDQTSTVTNCKFLAIRFFFLTSVRIPYNCPLARIRPLFGRYLPPEVVAVRVPLLHLSNFQINDWPELSAKSYAVMVLILPTESARKWRDHELELVEVVADQFRFVTGVVPGKEIKFVVVAKEQNTAHINTRFCTGTQVTKLTVNS